MKPVVVTPRAYGDVRRLENWLIDKDVNAAMRVGPLLFETMMSLSEFPERGVQALRSRGRDFSFRSAPTVTSSAIESKRHVC